MTRKSVKQEQRASQRMPISFAAIEQDAVEQPTGSGDTAAIDSDITMADDPMNEGYRTNRENRKTGKFWRLKVPNYASPLDFYRPGRSLKGRSPE